MSFSAESRGSFDQTMSWLKRMSTSERYKSLGKYGEQGVAALIQVTPEESGETARAWTYEIKQEKGSYSIIWDNTHIVNGRPIAILLQYGHATRTGGWVQGRDYINPALQPIFDRIAADAWKAVTT